VADVPAASATGDNRPVPIQLPRLTALRYVQPLREGGSLPAVVATDDGLYVVKFRGAGQGPKALIAEVVCGLLARHLGLPSPDLAAVEVPALFGRSEPDPEIQDLLAASEGINVGLRYLDGAFNFALSPAHDVDVELLARYLRSYEQIAAGDERGGPVALLPTSERFHWRRTARRSRRGRGGSRREESSVGGRSALSASPRPG